jgi:peptide/nickel transport system permease protein
MSFVREFIKKAWESWSTRIGIVFLAILIILSILVVLTYPMDFGTRVWSNPSYWADNPRLAPPIWASFFTMAKTPTHTALKLNQPTNMLEEEDLTLMEYSVEINYGYDDYPSFLHVLIKNVTFYSTRPPRIEVWIGRPDSLIVRLTSFTIRGPSPTEEPPYRRYVESPYRIILTEDSSSILNLIYSLNEKYDSNITLDEVSTIGSERLFFGCPSKLGGKGFSILRGPYRLYARVYVYDGLGSVGEVDFILGGKTYGLLGTDMIGRDLMMGLLYGFPASLMIGFLASVLVTSIGTFLGVLSGYIGGRTDTVIQRSSDVVLNMPLLPILIFFTFIFREFGMRFLLIILVLTAFSWPGLTIIIRPMVMQIKTSQFIEAAISCGASRRWIMRRHILPNLAPFIIAQSIFLVPSAILAEAALSFLGLGDPTLPTWGQILEQGFRSGAIYLGYWWWVIPPGTLIVFTAITFLLITIGLEPILNPKLKSVI